VSIGYKHVDPLFVEVTVLESNLFLPYVIEGADRKKVFSKDMEAAALLCIAEAERNKKVGIFRGSPEKLVVLSKLHYPLWVIPSDDSYLVIDGMGASSTTILYHKPPNIENFTEHLKRSSPVHELYHSSLRAHIDTFSRFTSRTEKKMEGLISDLEFMSDILTFIRDDRSEKGDPDQLDTLIPPKISEREAIESAEKIMNHYRRLRSEVRGLQFAIDALNSETEVHMSKLQEELLQIQTERNEQISKVKMEVSERKVELEKERDKKMEKIMQVNRNEVDSRLLEKRKLENELVKLEQNKSEYETRKELRKQKGDKVGESRWKSRLQTIKNQIRATKGKIRILSNFIDRINKETIATAKKLRDNYEKLACEVEKKISDLENLRNSEVEIHKQEITDLQSDVSTINSKIERLIERKEESTMVLTGSTIQWRVEAPTLVCLPIYLIRYDVEKRRRYCFRLPAVASSHEGLAMKIRKAFRGHSLQSRINTLLKTRFKALEKPASLSEKLTSNAGTSRCLDKLSWAHNLLRSADFKAKVEKGMGELEGEGWIKPEEKANTFNILVEE